ncbi:MAG: hypothetical protein D6689_02945, partial [Deltaproteobacteria bacterium]
MDRRAVAVLPSAGPRPRSTRGHADLLLRAAAGRAGAGGQLAGRGRPAHADAAAGRDGAGGRAARRPAGDRAGAPAG